MLCTPSIQTGDSPMVFSNVIPNYKPNVNKEKQWQKPYAPYCIANSNQCFGYENVPNEVSCDAAANNIRRLCLCSNILNLKLRNIRVRYQANKRKSAINSRKLEKSW